MLAVVLAVTASLAHAEDITDMVSQYRRAHGLPAVKSDPQLTAIAERQAKAMAASGVMDHSVAGSFSSRVRGAHSGVAAENIAAGTKNWSDTFRAWKHSSGHNANLLLAKADSVGFAVARNENTRYKTFWAMVIADKSPRKKSSGKVAAKHDTRRTYASAAPIENPIDTLKSFVCKYLC
ncbi:MAG: CAP domain-containing protein [Xanthobacteraceae bacterium]